MRYLYRRGPGARRRVMHLTLHDPVSGAPTMTPLCGSSARLDTTINVPMGRPTCRRCTKAIAQLPI